MATQRFRRNCIPVLKDEDGREVTDHQEMAGLLWASYKDRMGTKEDINMQFDLQRLLKRVDGLDVLTRPFST